MRLRARGRKTNPKPVQLAELVGLSAAACTAFLFFFALLHTHARTYTTSQTSASLPRTLQVRDSIFFSHPDVIIGQITDVRNGSIIKIVVDRVEVIAD